MIKFRFVLGNFDGFWKIEDLFQSHEESVISGNWQDFHARGGQFFDFAIEKNHYDSLSYREKMILLHERSFSLLPEDERNYLFPNGEPNPMDSHQIIIFRHYSDDWFGESKIPMIPILMENGW